MEVRHQVYDNSVVVTVAGKVDAVTAGVLENTMRELVDGGRANIVLDLEGVGYMSSAGLRVLFAYLQKLTALRGRLYLAAVQEPILEIFDTVGFLSVFKLFKSNADALREMAKPL
jgi:anti-anti-sigma factor